MARASVGTGHFIEERADRTVRYRTPPAPGKRCLRTGRPIRPVAVPIDVVRPASVDGASHQRYACPSSDLTTSYAAPAPNCHGT